MLKSIIDFISTQISSNQFFSGGAVLAALGIILAYLRGIPSYIFQWLKRRIITTIDIPDRDEAFKWLTFWLAQSPYKKRCRWWTVQTRRQRDYDESGGTNYSQSNKKPRIILSPAPGLHFLWYKHRLMILQRERKDGGEDRHISNILGYRETFNIRLFSRNKNIVYSLLEEAQTVANPQESERIRILRPDFESWCEAAKRMLRPLDSVILDGNLSENLLNDVKQFLESENWYNDHGIPYRRGYLLHGPPGNGKSSIVTAIASHLRLDICVLNLSSFGLTDEKLVALMSSIPVNSIVLIEDVDCVFKERQKVDGKEGITFSGLLNAVDGVMTSEGRILFMTTNHKETLASALIRPGRVDLDVCISDASKQQASRIFLRFFPDNNLAEDFANKITENISMAQLQGHLLKYRDSADEAINQLIQQETQ